MDSKRIAKEWAPSWVGHHVTGSSEWRLRLEGLELTLSLDGRTHRVNVEDEAAYRVNTGTFWTDITFHPGQGREVRADGLPNAQGTALVQALNVALTEKRLREDVVFLKGEQRTIDAWLDHKGDQERACLERRRWFTHEQQEDVLASRPTLDAAAMGDVTVEASTFHALGLRLIGKATGEKPDVPDWATDPAGGVRKISALLEQLKDSSVEFAKRWDLFRFVFGRDLPAFGQPEPADEWDGQGKGSLVTNRGERVKSMEEVMIANLLFLNGVDYLYEGRYPRRLRRLATALGSSLSIAVSTSSGGAPRNGL
ncbi:TPA: hypothetical protein UL921_001207 [Stenotrophomonas maltophilia]|nr:hypothetical protein [Stenotrophomonas maltophilia]